MHKKYSFKKSLKGLIPFIKPYKWQFIIASSAPAHLRASYGRGPHHKLFPEGQDLFRTVQLLNWRQ